MRQNLAHSPDGSQLDSQERELRQLTRYLEDVYNLGERIEFFRANRFYTAEIEVSRRCALECSYCYSASTKRSAKELSPDNCWSLLRQLAECGIREVCWLGGEPLEWRWLPEAISRANALGLKNVVFTNGSRLGPVEIRSLIRHAEWVSLHLDTIKADIFSELHLLGEKESRDELRATITGIENLLMAGFPPKKIRLAVVLSKPSFRSLNETLHWGIHTKGFYTSTLITLAALGRGTKLADRLLPAEDEITRAYATRADVEGRPELLRLGLTEFCKHYELTNFFVDVDGYLYPYVGVRPPCGNVRATDLESILSTQYASLSFSDCVDPSSFHNKVEGHCGNCINGSLCFGTRTYAHLREQPKGSEPLCWYRE